MSIDDVLNWFIPDSHATPKAQRMYRLRVAMVACGSFMVVYGFIIPAMFTGFPVLGQLAWANDINTKISEAIKPIEGKVNTIETKVDKLDLIVRQQLAVTLATQIREAKRRWCALPASSQERDRTQTDIDRLQEEYMGLRGQPYNVLPCTELNGGN